MANMSYCRFENTRPDLQDCVESLYEDELTVDSSSSEKNAAADMYEAAKQYVLEYEAWLDRREEEETDDNDDYYMGTEE